MTWLVNFTDADSFPLGDMFAAKKKYKDALVLLTKALILELAAALEDLDSIV